MSHCRAKHTKYQPTDNEWKCPLCGISDDGEYFYIDSFGDDVKTDDCNLLHKTDGVICTNCKKAWTGESISRLFAKIAGMTPCLYCKGTGFVKKS